MHLRAAVWQKTEKVQSFQWSNFRGRYGMLRGLRFEYRTADMLLCFLDFLPLMILILGRLKDLIAWLRLESLCCSLVACFDHWISSIIFHPRLIVSFLVCRHCVDFNLVKCDLS
jgi:hypothetical protein